MKFVYLVTTIIGYVVGIAIGISLAINGTPTHNDSSSIIYSHECHVDTFDVYLSQKMCKR